MRELEGMTNGELIVSYRQSCTDLYSVLINNGRRGGSAGAANEINALGEDRAQHEQELLRRLENTIPDGCVAVRRETAGVSRVAVKAKLKSGYVSNGSARYQRAYDDLRAALERKATK